jgi:PKHD-type hydroxylase
MDSYFTTKVPESICDIASAELNEIESITGKLKDNTEINLEVRNSTIKFAPDWYWFNGVLNQIVAEANFKAGWNFILNKLETVQYSEYKSGQHYNWHIDTKPMSDGAFDRKITVICAMNSLDEYTGGQLEIKSLENEIIRPKLNKGDVIVFPSFLLHRVTPVKSGVRYSATMWLSGPAFR